tara:strand:- start:51 stop:317 length:267 start_codon:yes stop_codon:yes gene_type:complete
MGNQKKVYDNPKDAVKDLFTIGGAAIINKALQTPIEEGKKKVAEWVEVIPGSEQVLKTAKKLKKKGFYTEIDPLKKRVELGWKKELGG